MLTINTTRTYKQAITLSLLDEHGKEQTGSFKAIFRILPTSKLIKSKKSLLDEVLVSVEDIRLLDDKNKPLEGDDLLVGVKDDRDLAVALIEAYNESITKKMPRVT